MTDEWIKATQQSLGTHVKKPPLTDKLLAKPPFRFLFDVISAVINSTGFMQGLYSNAELNPEKDKDGKIAFLQKSIDVVQFVTRGQLLIKPSKTVAGQEPEKTNEFLQALAKAISLHKDGADTATAVQKVLAGEKPDVRNSDGSAGSSNKENREVTTTKTEKSGSEKREKSKEKSSTKKEKEPTPALESKSKKTTDESKAKNRDKSKDSVDGEKKKSKSSGEKEKRSKSKEKTASQEVSKDEKPIKDKEKKKKSSSKDRDSSKEKKKKKKDKETDLLPNGSIENDAADDTKLIPNGDIHHPDLVKSTLLQRPSSSKVEDSLEDRNESITQSKRPPSGIVRTVRQPTAAGVRPGTALGARPGTAIGARPGTALGGRPGTAAARPAPPKMKVRTEVLPELEKPVERIDSGKSAANVISEKPVSASSKKATAQEDEESAFIVEETAHDDFQRILAGKDDDDRIDEDLDETGESHGALVNKILETKKELESGLQEFAKADANKTLVVLDASEREKIRAESKRLQSFIQQLTRNSHPLGKMMDFLQEDIDSMIKELNSWRQEYKENAAKLRQSGAISGLDLDSMRSKLAEFDQQINDQHEALASMKASIMTNRERAEQLMTRLLKK